MVKDFLFDMLGYVGIILLIVLILYGVIYFATNILKFFKGLFKMYCEVKKCSWLTSNMDKYLIIDIEDKTICGNMKMSSEEQIKVLEETIIERKRLEKKCEEMKQYFDKHKVE